MTTKIPLTRFLLSIALLTSTLAYSQDTSNAIGSVSIASPTAAALGKYGDIPVNYHTGIPQISIPIYTVKSGQLSLPITLSYHASGLKVQEQASWVGAGFSLNAGGCITRTVMGAPDDRGYNTTTNNNVTNGYYSDYGYYSYMNNSSGVPDAQAFSQGTKDGEPDLYFFNFGSYTGKFYFNDDRTPILVPEEDFKIQPDYHLGQGFAGFVITTPDGTKYYFGKTGNNDSINPIESTISSTLANGPSFANAAASSWFLNKIVNAEGTDSISLSYTQEKYSFYNMAMIPVNSINYNPADASNCGYSLVKNFVTGVRLNHITFANGTITFTKAAAARIDLSGDSTAYNDMTDVANTSSYALGSIIISDNNGFCKKDSLYYGYFHNGSTLPLSSGVYGIYNLHSDTSRLRLDSMQESTCDARIALPPYKFSYFSEPAPRNLSFGIDHWGFYNGVESNGTLVPTYTVTVGGIPGTTTTYSGADRDAGWPAMRGGALHQITYPLGGHTTMDFDPNTTYTYATGLEFHLDLNISAGFSGSHPAVADSLVATGNAYDVYLHNTANQEGRCIITKANHSTVQEIIYIEPGDNYTTSRTYTAGKYYFDFSWTTTPTTGGGFGVQIEYSHNEIVSNYYNSVVGGLRIKTITNNDGVDSTDVVTSYLYTNGSNPGAQTSGILYSRPTYVQVIRNDNFGLVWPYCGSSNGCSTCDGLGAHAYYVSPGSIRPMATTQGYHIGYNEVAVTQTNNGKKIYRYYGSDIWDSPNPIGDVCTRSLIQSSTCSSDIPTFPAAPLPFEFKRGELKYEAAMDSSGHVITEAYHYPVYQNDSLTTPGHISATGLFLYTFTDYNLQSARKVKDSTYSFLYDKANAVVTLTKTYYDSRYHHQPTRTVTSTSTGDSLITNTKYAMDFRVSACETIPDSLAYYNSAVSAAATDLSDSIGICSPQADDASNCRVIIFNNYREKLARARVKFINYRRRSFADSLNTTDTCYKTALAGADALLKPILRLQREYNNAPIEVSSWRNLKLLQASFTKYDTSLIPLGFAYPGKTLLLDLAVPSSTFAAAAISGNSISTDGRYVNESLYKFAAGNPLEVTGKNGITTAYLWDYKNTLPIAKVSNAANAIIAYTSFEADGTGNWTVASASRDSTTAAITGTKSYNLSNGNISKAGLTSGNVYIVTYWSTNGAKSISGGSGSSRTGRTVNGWTYYEHTISASSTTITLSGSGSIDELRLYPQVAQMTTYTYTPLVGMSSMADQSGVITYYEYDGLARLKNIKDYQGNIVKNYQYNYMNSCGENCIVLPMQNLNGGIAISYPVGVFNINGRLLGNATSQSGYVTLWMSDTTNSHIGTLSAGGDSVHFHLSLNTGKTAPAAVTGLRYYQFDLAYTVMDCIRNANGAYVDFGDSTGMMLGKSLYDTSSMTLASNTVKNIFPNSPQAAFVHTYPNNNQKTITIYHNDGYNYETAGLYNWGTPATCMTKVKNLRGNIPQYETGFFGLSYQDSTMNTVANITNWNSITSIATLFLGVSDGVNAFKHMNYAQDFFQNNKGLSAINLANLAHYYDGGVWDSTFRLSRLKSNWNTYFTKLNLLEINESNWNHEDLSGLVNLKGFVLIADNQNHSMDTTGNHLIPIPSSEIDSIINQIAAGAGQTITNGTIVIYPGGTGNDRTSASNTAVGILLSKGWAIYIEGVAAHL